MPKKWTTRTSRNQYRRSAHQIGAAFLFVKETAMPSLKFMPKLPPHPRQALFAASLARDLKAIADTVDGNTAVIRLVAERLCGMPRVTDLAEVGRIAKDLGNVVIEVERELRRLRAVHDELRDFVG
jgi:hypothetical protein